MQTLRKKTHSWLDKKYRKVYRFICDGCGKLRMTFHIERMQSAAKQAFLPIPAGQVAMQIPTGELVGVGGYIQPDDRIDILVTASIYPKGTNPADAKPYTKTTFTNLHVIRVGPAGGANTRGISSSLTVIVTLKQAEDLKFLLDSTNYKFVLKSVKDYDQVDAATSATTDQSFIQSYHLR